MICIYEDEGVAGLGPLVDLRPVFDLRCGRRTLLEKLLALYPGEETNLWVRDELAQVTAEAHPGFRVNRPVRKGRLFLSGRFIPRRRISPQGRESVLLCGDEAVGFRVCGDCAVRMSSLAGLTADLAEERVEGEVVSRPWDIVELNARELQREVRVSKGKGQSAGRLGRGVVVVGSRARLVVRRGARVWPGVVLSTETGPIEIDAGAEVRPGSLVEGPCYVGRGTVIDGAKVRPGCSFGPQCRIGGEAEACVFQGYANKHHDGFLGHSFVGEWVNLGAGTSNSDLKNAYQPVTVELAGRRVDTGLLKVGCFVGDHAKAAIGTLFNTGAVIGTFANWFEPGLSPRTIRPFVWGAKARWSRAAMLACAQAVMTRRGGELSKAYERLLVLRFRRS